MKRNYECHFSYETNPNLYISFKMMKSAFKRLHHAICLIPPEIRTQHGWGLSHLKFSLHLRTQPYLRDLCVLMNQYQGLSYLRVLNDI